MPELPTNPLGATDLDISRVGFGAWAIGGPAMAGDTAIGWGETDDDESVRALETALDRGITFFDTADFYGLGHSEELIGRVIGNRPDVAVATKVGHRLNPDGSISLDYSKSHILAACEASLRRLGRDRIDLYQLHSARVEHLEAGECVEAMERLTEEGKIRYWGLSLNTYKPHPEAGMMMDRGIGHSFQLVLSVINQRAVDIIRRASSLGYGIIARMPLQFGLLAGRFDPGSRFARNDHRSFRLTP
ncbi:MAG: aldo/keto reductase, partial [Rhodothermales bacterium]|nr:aldo/keto reductase [Rhodothermales bacterium]